MKNVGSTDKVIRYIIGVVLLSLLFIIPSNLKYIGLLGLVPILTAAFGFCPLYAIFGIKTCPVKK
ncbi:DUF2892 domain-containing protein [Ectobacillus sp. sgz5001026]|uniref:YgaP family membrane protein n=1 Tax=Ectobacillus sp. sgz5001026 TaxID=3242473 RepID=UPI0036D23C6C